jgi:hypothetical protein
MDQEAGEKFLKDLDKPVKGFGAPDDDGFDDSFDQIKQQ